MVAVGGRRAARGLRGAVAGGGGMAVGGDLAGGGTAEGVGVPAVSLEAPGAATARSERAGCPLGVGAAPRRWQCADPFAFHSFLAASASRFVVSI